MARQALSLSEERQRVVEVGEIIGAVPDAAEAMTHVARTMAHVTHTDQAALLVLDIDNPDRFQVEVIFSPERPVELTSRFEQWLTLANFEALHQAIAGQRQLMFLPQHAAGPLSILYSLWYEDRVGPTLIQPLTVYGQPVGVLVLGNPATQRPIREANQLLCQSLAAQIGSMVEAHRQYCALAETSKAQLAAVMEAQAVTQPSAVAVASGDETQLGRPARPPKQPPQQDNGDIDMMDERLSILEAVHEGVVVSDATGRVQLVNRAAERILGKARLDLLGQPISTVYGAINSTDSIEDLAAAFSRRNEPLPTFTRNKDRIVQGQLIPWRNGAREWMGIIAVFSDITHEVKANQARSDFVTALSHELRAQLTTIRGYSELIIQGDLEEYTPEQMQVQKIMHSSVDRMVAVLDNAVQLGVHTRKDYGPEFASVDVAEIINEVVYDISPLVTLHELTLETDINPNLPQLMADPKHIYRILENLLENGCQFTPPGGHLAVRAWVQQERAGNRLSAELILMVADNGIGIARSELGKIFDPYFQIPNAANRGGMGMGLAVVKKLVELNRGRVWVESVPGEGSLFQVAFLLAED
jgi:PAS domain S-box-containing protein